MSVVIDPYSINLYYLNPQIEYYFNNLAYFSRFGNLKFLQFQAADDQYFPPDSEVIYFKYIAKIGRLYPYLGLLLE
jgi:hypothetical protein